MTDYGIMVLCFLIGSFALFSIVLAYCSISDGETKS